MTMSSNDGDDEFASSSSQASSYGPSASFIGGNISNGAQVDISYLFAPGLDRLSDIFFLLLCIDSERKNDASFSYADKSL